MVLIDRRPFRSQKKVCVKKHNAKNEDAGVQMEAKGLSIHKYIRIYIYRERENIHIHMYTYVSCIVYTTYYTDKYMMYDMQNTA